MQFKVASVTAEERRLRSSGGQLGSGQRWSHAKLFQLWWETAKLSCSLTFSGKETSAVAHVLLAYVEMPASSDRSVFSNFPPSQFTQNKEAPIHREHEQYTSKCVITLHSFHEIRLKKGPCYSVIKRVQDYKAFGMFSCCRDGGMIRVEGALGWAKVHLPQHCRGSGAALSPHQTRQALRGPEEREGKIPPHPDVHSWWGWNCCQWCVVDVLNTTVSATCLCLVLNTIANVPKFSFDWISDVRIYGRFLQQMCTT